MPELNTQNSKEKFTEIKQEDDEFQDYNYEDQDDSEFKKELDMKMWNDDWNSEQIDEEFKYHIRQSSSNIQQNMNKQ